MKADKRHCYDDMLYLPRPVVTGHPPMAVQDRAAQFAPFAALTGHEAAIRETARLTRERRELDEDEKAVINGKLQLLRENLSADMSLSITYFLPDSRKEGGAYQTVRGRVGKILDYEHSLQMEDGTRIPMEEIVDMELYPY